jgi:hypothetical protein
MTHFSICLCVVISDLARVVLARGLGDWACLVAQRRPKQPDARKTPVGDICWAAG